MDIQKEAKSQNLPRKIWIHEGEMVMAGEDIFGDGVDVASRIQEISPAGSITISGRVYSDVKSKAGIKTKFIGDKRLKNVDDPVNVYMLPLELPWNIFRRMLKWMISR
jgi:class 3 adenylate cyclase